MKNSCDRIIYGNILVSVSAEDSTVDATLQVELWDHHEGFAKEIMETNFVNLNILSHFANMKVLKVEIRRGFLEKAMLLSPIPLPCGSFWVWGVWPPISNIGKNIQLNHLEFKMCTFGLGKHSVLPTMDAWDIKRIAEQERNGLTGQYAFPHRINEV